MLEIKAPEFINKLAGRTYVFLAGSIENGTAEDWQEVVTNLLSEFPITILNPRRDDWDFTWEQSYYNPKFYQQVMWEQNSLELSDIVYMHFSKDTKSPISLMEFGLLADSKKMIVYCPDGFWRKGNIEITCSRFNIPLFNDFEESLKYLKEKIRNKV